MGAVVLMFDAQAKAKAAEGKYPPFQFRGVDGTEHTLPHPMTLTERHGAMVAAGNVLAVVLELNEAAHAAINEMPMFVSSQLAEAWLAQAGEEGKELSPSSETPNDGEPSKPTSPAEGSTSTT